MNKLTYDDYTTSVLSISSKTIKDCSDVANTLLKCGIICSVTSNDSVCGDNNQCWIEKGCNITLSGVKPDKLGDSVWNPLKKEYNLNCAHLHILGGYKGCIINFLRPSNCNWAKPQ